MSLQKINSFIYELWSCETEEEVIQLLKQMSQSRSPALNIQKPLIIDNKELSTNSNDRNSMIINCWINGVYKEMSLDEVFQAFKEFNSKKIN